MPDSPDERPIPAKVLAQIDPNGAYTLDQVVEIFVQISGSGSMWRAPRSRQTIRKLLSDVREPGRIWARNLGGSDRTAFWVVPGLSILEFLRGDARSGCCPTCGRPYKLHEFLDDGNYTREEVRRWMEYKR